MANRTDGVQQLLQAERASAEKVAEARKRKVRRLKQAKDEAQQEVDAYRKDCENKYKEHEQKMIGSRGDMQAKIEQETKVKVEEIKIRVDERSNEAIDKLLKMVCDIKPELHINYRPKDFQLHH